MKKGWAVLYSAIRRFWREVRSTESIRILVTEMSPGIIWRFSDTEDPTLIHSIMKRDTNWFLHHVKDRDGRQIVVDTNGLLGPKEWMPRKRR